MPRVSVIIPTRTRAHIAGEAIDSLLAQTYHDFGVSRSAVSRRLQEASAKALQGLCERRFEEVDLLAIYLDGKGFGGHQVVSP